MKDGFIKVAAVIPQVEVANPLHNVTQMKEKLEEARALGAHVVVFPELCISGYTCGDLFLQESLLRGSLDGLLRFAKETASFSGISFVGLPLMYRGQLYNVAAAVHRGEILGFVPKTFLPNYSEFYEARYFARGMEDAVEISIGDKTVSMGTRLLFSCESIPELVIGAEICEDLWTAQPPSVAHALNGATLIANLSASDEVTGKDIYRKDLVKSQSARLLCGYIYASAGEGESTQDVVYSGHSLIAENGTLLQEAKRFTNETIVTEIDVQKLIAERRRMSTFENRADGYCYVPFTLPVEETTLTRFVDPAPFVPSGEQDLEKRCQEILMIQSTGLKKRLAHTHCRHAVIGISGGLDSTLALLVTVRAFDLLGLDRSQIIAVTMPGFGTTDRTYDNAVHLIETLGATFREVDIKEAVRVHFRDIGQDESVHDVTYENGQARERTQILMNIANKVGGLVIGKRGKNE